MLVGAVVRRFTVASITVASVTVASIAVGAAVTSPPVAAAGSTCAPDAASYTVRSGDGWYVIAERAGVSASALLAANDADVDDVLVPGDELCLPEGADVTAACQVTREVATGDGWFSIAQRAGVTVDDVLAVNGARLGRVLHPGDVICLPANAGGAGTAPVDRRAGSASGSNATYTVVRGDSWFDIAARAGVSMRQLLAANDTDADGRLWPGDVVQLPSGASAPAGRSAAASGGVRMDAMPLQGPCWYFDTWHAPRGAGRLHIGVDIITEPGKYVYAVADGRLTGRAWDQPGRISGNAWHLTADDGTRYFYAHLQDFAPNLRVGSRVEAGEIIGWVGATGNASTAHLHFEVHVGGTTPVNPYPIVKTGGGCNRATPYTQPSGWTPD